MKQSTQPLLQTSQVDGQAILGQVRPALCQGALGCRRDPSWGAALLESAPNGARSASTYRLE